MPVDQELVIDLYNSEQARHTGKLFLTSYSKNDRIQRAISALAVCWALGSLFIFPIIPILHIFLSAILFITGPVLFAKRIKQEDIKHRAEGTCPSCAKDVSLELDNSDPLPQWIHCPECHLSVQLVSTAPKET